MRLESPVVDETTEAAVEPGRIRLHLRKVLLSPAFRTSPRCQTFLAYLVEKSLDGQAGSLKERMLAVEVFGQSAEANLAEDTIVRVSAREVRRRLAQYLLDARGGRGRRSDRPADGLIRARRASGHRPRDGAGPAARRDHDHAVFVVPPIQGVDRRGRAGGAVGTSPPRRCWASVRSTRSGVPCSAPEPCYSSSAPRSSIRRRTARGG